MLRDIPLVKAVMDNDPAVKSPVEAILCYPCVWALGCHRVSHWLYRKRLYLLARVLSQSMRFLTGIEIHPGARIGTGVFIDHGMGVVIGETAEVGNNVVMFHGVTLGGTGKDKGKRHPTVEDGAYIGARATILGPITIGRGAKIGAGAVVLTSVPPYATAVGVPARVVRQSYPGSLRPAEVGESSQLLTPGPTPARPAPGAGEPHDERQGQIVGVAAGGKHA